MGKHFGNLQYLKGVNYYVLSPNELKPLKGILVPGILNTLRRMKESFFFVVVPIAAGYTIYDQVSKAHKQSQRKNPDDYKNDE